MPMNGAERQRRYRLKLREENPEKLLKQKRDNLERTKKNYKNIAELTEHQKTLQREKWRKQKNKNKDEATEMIKKVKQRRYYRKLMTENLNLKSRVKLMATKTKTMQRKINRLKKKIELMNKKQKVVNENEQEKQQEQKKQQEHEEVNEESKRTPYSKTETIINEMIPQISTPAKQVVKKILFENLVIKESIQNQYSQATNNSERGTLKKVVNNDITAKYKMKTNLSAYLGLKGRLRVRQRLNQYKIKRMKELTAFYERDDNSRATAGKKEFRTLHKTRKQVRYLLDTLRNLHKKYRNEGGKLAYATFARYKPFYVLSPKLVDRNTCACVKHANLSFMASKLKQLSLISTDNLTQLVSTISCNVNDKKCMYNECDTCSNKSFEFNLAKRDLSDIVSWKGWVTKQFTYSKNTDNKQKEEKTTKRTVKEEITGSLETLKQTFTKQLRLFKKHHFNISHQFKMYTECKNNLTENEIVLHCDFSENYVCKLTEEVQAMHFGASKRQITLHTGVIYVNENGPQTISFSTISQNNNHTPGAIWAHLTPVLKFVKEKFPAVKTIHFFTDGPTSQYRQKKNFSMMNTEITQLGFKNATWSFFEASHGKGAADGIGGATKRNLDRYVTHGHDIPDAKAAYDALIKEDSKIKYFLVPDEDIKNMTEKIDATSLIAVPNTMSIHQVISTPNTRIIKFRELSCFCGSQCGICGCFDLKEHNLGQKTKNNNRQVHTMKKKRFIHSKKNSKKAAEDSDTSTDSMISYAESDNSPYEDETDDREERWWESDEEMEIEEPDCDYMKKNEESLFVEGMVKNQKTTEIKKDKSRVTILSEIRYRPENHAYSDLKQYDPFKKIDNNFCTSRNKENVRNIYDDPVPSTSGVQQKQVRNMEIKINQNKYTRKTDTNYTYLEKKEEDKMEDKKRLNQNKKTIEEKTESIAKVLIENQNSNNYNITDIDTDNTHKKKTETSTNTFIEDQKSNSDVVTDINIDDTGKENTKRSTKALIEDQKINSDIITDINDTHTYSINIKVNDSVLVRYYEKKKWMYYIGFVERVENKNMESFYTINFLKTVKKPDLKFLHTKKCDRDKVPAICVIKKVNLKLISKEYVLCDEGDQIYFF